MNLLFLLITVFVVTGCEQQQTPRQFTEKVSKVSEAPMSQEQPMAGPKPVDNPHAGIDMGANITPDARENLQKMLSDGQDPHAGIDMSAFAGKDPHAGMDMPAMMGSGAGAPADDPYSWVLPKGWKQGADRVMRLASFYIEKDPDAIDCYIVALPGMAGGVEANLKRWMGQIGLDPSDANYKKLVETSRTVQTQGGMEAKYYDLRSLQQGPSEKSMIAAIIMNNDTSIFVKMTGTGKHVEQNRDSFFQFLKSLSLKK